MSRGSGSRETSKGEIIRKFGFLLSDSKMLTRENRLSYTVPALWASKSSLRSRKQNERTQSKLARSTGEFYTEGKLME
jgi:hypothetical protein